MLAIPINKDGSNRLTVHDRVVNGNLTIDVTGVVSNTNHVFSVPAEYLWELSSHIKRVHLDYVEEDKVLESEESETTETP